MKRHLIPNNERGTILMLVVVSAFIMSIVGLGSINLMGLQEIQAREELYNVRVGNLADAGIEYGKMWFNTNCISRHTFPERVRFDADAADPTAPFECGTYDIGGGRVTVQITPDPNNGPNNPVRGKPSDYKDGISPYTESPGFTSGLYTITATAEVPIGGGTQRTVATRSMTFRYFEGALQFTPTGNDIKAAGFNTVTMLQDASSVLVAGGSTKYSPEIVGSDSGSSMSDITKAASIFNPDANDGRGGFESVGNMKIGRAKHTATLLSTGEVLIAGGYGDNDEKGVRQGEIFSPVTRKFTYTGSMSTSRTCHNAVYIASTDEVLLMGGFADPSNYNDTFESYYDGAFHNVHDEGGTQLTMSVPRHCFVSLTLPNGDIFIAGGKTAPNTTPYTNVYTKSFEIYIPSSRGVGNLTHPAFNMKESRRDFSAELINTDITPGTTQYEILCVGGYVGTSKWSDQTDKAEIITLRKNLGAYTCSTKYTDKMNAPRSDMYSAQISSHQWIFAGGIKSEGDSEVTVDTCEIYDTETGRFSPLEDSKDLDPARHCENNSLTMDKNGDILLTGGWSAGEVPTVRSGRIGPERLLNKKANTYVESPMVKTGL